MTEHRKKIAKEEFKKCINHLNEMFLPYLSDKGKESEDGGVAERWIYEMSAGEETVVESAVKLLEKISIESFLRIARIMSDLRLSMCDLVLSRLLGNEKLETGKRAFAADMLMKKWDKEISGVPEKINKILDFKKCFSEFYLQDGSSEDESLETLIKSLNSEELSAGLLLVLQEMSSAELLSNLEKLIGLSSDFDLIIVKVLSDIGSDECVRVFEKIFIQTENRKVKKEINKAIFKLKKKGVSIDEGKFKEEKRDPFSSGTVETGGYVSAMMDGGTIQLVMFYIHHSVKGYQLFNALRSVNEGLLDLSVNKVTKKGVKKYLDYLKNERNTAVFSVSAEHCRYLLEESVDITLQSGRELSRHYDKWKKFIGEHVKLSEDSEIYRYFDKTKLSENPSLSILDEMSPQEIISLSLISNDDLPVVFEKYRELDESGIILKESLKGEMEKRKAADITQEFFTESRKKIIIRKIEELSLLLYISAKKAEAEKLLCLALEANSALKASDSVFLTRLVGVYLEIFKSEIEAGKKEVPETQLITDTYEKES